MMTQSKIYDECFVCHSGYNCGGTNTITSQQRQQLESVLPFLEMPFGAEVCKCNLDCSYDFYKEWYQHIPFLEKYGQMMLDMVKELEESWNFEQFCFDIHEGKIELFWKWEDDNGLYVTDGTMKALWSIEEDDETWSKQETKSLCDDYGVDYQKVDNFMEFLEVRYNQEVFDNETH